MLFIVPDVDQQASVAPAGGPEPGKAPSFKVELDLDDAPFLEEPVEEAKKEAPPPQETVPAKQESSAAPKGSKLKAILERLKANKKKLILAGGACGVLLIAAILVNTLFFSGEKTAATEPAGPKRVTIKSEPEPAAPAEPVYTVNWEPFLVELRGSEGEIRLLHCQFSTPTKDPMLQSELLAKKIVLRDAIYYYLRNKPLTFLTDATKQATLREDLISVINEHVSSAKISELYFEEYVIRGS